MDTEIYSSFSEEDTFQLGIDFSERLNPGDVVAFYGDLGAGKTEFIKGICQGMSVEEIVASPTYTIVNQYVGEDARRDTVDIFHVDLYRIENSAELLEIGLSDLIANNDSIKLIEWAENAEALLPVMRYDIFFVTLDDENSRRIEIVHRDGAIVESTRTHVYSR